MTCEVLRVRGSGYDENGDPVTGETRTLLERAYIAPRSTGDITDRGRAGVTVGLSLYAPYGTDLLHTDQVEVDGVLYDVDGEVAQWRNPFTGWNAGSETALKRAAG